MGWTALSSELGHLKALHGANVLLFLNIAYYAPSLPILVTQLVAHSTSADSLKMQLWDPRLNRKLGAAKAALVRQCVALPVCFICTLSLPYLPWTSLPTLIAASAVIGTAASVAFGSSSQLVARFPSSCGQALVLGIVSSGPIVLLLQFCLELGPHPSDTQQRIFFGAAAMFPLVSLYCLTRLLRRYWVPLQAGNVLLPFTGAAQVAVSPAPPSEATSGLTDPESSSILVLPAPSTTEETAAAPEDEAAEEAVAVAESTEGAAPHERQPSPLTAANLQQSQHPQHSPSAPSMPVLAQNIPEYDEDSLICGHLSMPDTECEQQDTFRLFGPVSHLVESMPLITSAAPLADSIHAPLLVSHAVSGSIPDTTNTPLLPVGPLADMHVTLPDASQYTLLAAAPLAVEVPWSPTGSLPLGAPVQSTTWLESLQARAAEQAGSEARRQVIVNSQFVNEVAESSSFWLTHLGTPREGAILVGNSQAPSIAAALVPESRRSDSFPTWAGSFTPSIITTVDAAWPQDIPIPVPIPSQQLAPQPPSTWGLATSLKSVTWNIAPLALCLFSSVTVSVMLFPVFTVVRSSGTLGCMLPQALFAARMVSDIYGRVLASARQPPMVATVKSSMLPIALLYLWQPPKFLSDVAALLFVAVHWILSGLVGAWSFMLLPNFFAGPESAAYAGTVMSAAYQGGTIAGLVLATLLEYVLSPPSNHVAPLQC